MRVFSDDELEEYAAFYEEHGAVRLPGLVTPDERETLLKEISIARQQAGEPREAHATPFYTRGDGKMTINRMWATQPAVRDFILQHDVVRPIAKVTRTKQLRFWFDLTFIHELGAAGDAGAGTPWHHDIGAFGFKGDQLPSLWMTLTPTDANRSRLLFVDRSHKTTPGFLRPPLQKDTPLADGHLDVPDVDALVASGEAEILTWDCDAGDAIIIHPFTIHGAHGNKGTEGHGSRIAITTRWLGDDVRWIPTAYGGQRPRPEEADIPVGGRASGPDFPLIWNEAG